MAPNPNAQRPRVAGWPRPYASSIALNVVEYSLLKEYATREGLALGAAVRELAITALILDTVTNPDRDEFGDALDRVRLRELGTPD